MKHKLKWYLDRIGKRVYRTKGTCKCKDCQDVEENGIVVRDEFHARYLEMVQYDLDLDYSDKQDEE